MVDDWLIVMCVYMCGVFFFSSIILGKTICVVYLFNVQLRFDEGFRSIDRSVLEEIFVESSFEQFSWC